MAKKQLNGVHMELHVVPPTRIRAPRSGRPCSPKACERILKITQAVLARTHGFVGLNGVQAHALIEAAIKDSLTPLGKGAIHKGGDHFTRAMQRIHPPMDRLMAGE